MANFKVENKGEVHMGGHRTSFDLFEREEGALGNDVFVFVGHFFATGWNLSDAKCIEFALEERDAA